MKVFLSPLAERKIQLLLEYLENEWSIKARKEFLSIFTKKIKQISSQPESCMRSKEFPNLYKCVITKQTSIFYRIVSNEIEIITIIDNRQDPDKIKTEVINYFK
jgi:plasmid stabilization system protein ParE